MISWDHELDELLNPALTTVTSDGPPRDALELAHEVEQRDPRAQVNLGARYAFEGINKKPIIIRANVNNVFDANYWYSTSFGQMSVSSPRTFLLSTTFNF